MSRIDTLVEDSLEILRMRGAILEPKEAALPRRDSLWVSRTSGRRGRVLWALEGRVGLSFDDLVVGVEHALDDFLRLYREVK